CTSTTRRLRGRWRRGSWRWWGSEATRPERGPGPPSPLVGEGVEVFPPSPPTPLPQRGEGSKSGYRIDHSSLVGASVEPVFRCCSTTGTSGKVIQVSEVAFVSFGFSAGVSVFCFACDFSASFCWIFCSAARRSSPILVVLKS